MFAIRVRNHNPFIIGVGPVDISGDIVDSKILNAVGHSFKQIRTGLVVCPVILSNLFCSIIGPINLFIFIVGR